jgi:hypothetical protein
VQVEVGSGDRVLPLASFRGTTRPVLLAGSKAYLQKAQAAAEPYRQARATIAAVMCMRTVCPKPIVSTWLTVRAVQSGPTSAMAVLVTGAAGSRGVAGAAAERSRRDGRPDRALARPEARVPVRLTG